LGPRGAPRAFLTAHARDIVAIDFFVVPTLTFHLLFVFDLLLLRPNLHIVWRGNRPRTTPARSRGRRPDTGRRVSPGDQPPTTGST
jgi:hypothetical protein